MYLCEGLVGPLQLLWGAPTSGGTPGGLELPLRTSEIPAVEMPPSRVVVQRDSPPESAPIAHRFQRGERGSGPLLRVSRIGDGEHVKSIDLQERQVRRRCHVGGFEEVRYGTGGVASGVANTTSLEQRTRDHLGTLSRHRIEHAMRFVEALLEAESSRHLCLQLPTLRRIRLPLNSTP